MRIVALDRVDLPVAPPLFNLPLAPHRRFRRVVRLEPDKPINPISRCEPGHRPDLVFPYAPREFGSYPNIEGPIWFIREQINVEHRAVAEIGPGLRRDGVREKELMRGEGGAVLRNPPGHVRSPGCSRTVPL